MRPVVGSTEKSVPYPPDQPKRPRCGARRLDADAVPPTAPGPDAERLGRLGHQRHLIGAQRLDGQGRQVGLTLDQTAVAQHPGEPGIVGRRRDQLPMGRVEARVGRPEAAPGRLDLHRTGGVQPVGGRQTLGLRRPEGGVDHAERAEGVVGEVFAERPPHHPA